MKIKEFFEAVAYIRRTSVRGVWYCPITVGRPLLDVGFPWPVGGGNDEHVHHYQRERAPITGFGL